MMIQPVYSWETKTVHYFKVIIKKLNKKDNFLEVLDLQLYGI